MVFLWEMMQGGINWEGGLGTYTQQHTKLMSDKDLPSSTGKSAQYSVIAYMGKESEKEWIYMYMYG